MNACQEYISDAKSECIKAILEVCLAPTKDFKLYLE